MAVVMCSFLYSCLSSYQSVRNDCCIVRNISKRTLVNSMLMQHKINDDFDDNQNILDQLIYLVDLRVSHSIIFELEDFLNSK